MRILTATLLLSIITLLAPAREYKSMKAYRTITGNRELNKRDWLTKHRKNNTREWIEACAFNFSYATGYYEYATAEQRRDFYLWLQNQLRSKGHEVYWPAMAAEISDRIKSMMDRNDHIGQFTRIANRTVFDSTFSTLQRFFRQEEVLTGESAMMWDRAMIEMEQEEIIQPIYNRMGAHTLRKLNKMARREGMYALMLSSRFEFSGDLKEKQDRIDYAQNVLIPYVKGEPMLALQKKKLENKEPKDITEEKEKIGERREAEMDKNLYRDQKKREKAAARHARNEEKKREKWNRRELKLNVRAIERSAIDPNKY